MTKKYFKTELPITNKELYNIMVKKVSEKERIDAGFEEFMDVSDYTNSSMIYTYENGSHVEFFDFGNVPISIEGKNINKIKSKLEELLKLNLNEIKTKQAGTATA